jgi:hypothetical protein
VRFTDLYAIEVADGAIRNAVHAAGIIGQRAPLAAALLRLFVGGDPAAKAVSDIMRRMLVGKAFRMGDPIGEASADLVACMVLQWHRDNTCRTCGGHGFRTVLGELGAGRTVIGDTPCPDCCGKGKRNFERLFPRNRVQLALWLRDEVERETAFAGAEAMRVLAQDFA